MTQRWTWVAAAHFDIASAFDGSNWCARLESAASDALVGKVLCVCASLAVARQVVGPPPAEPRAAEALDLLSQWIDDPTKERFGRICDTIFGPGERPELGPHGVVWCALRTATSSVGNGEAGWALDAACGAAGRAGFAPEAIRAAAWSEVLSRQRRAEPDAAPETAGR